ncbi:methyltransferase domain-containing protein [Candidatus Methylacidithermus pantelleriae]|uniref:SAM-dependent methyltransferase n=1 Tax=Candidatus Methylacidithermus pantelleriae TaxID=2744239 RepID=A0A8J2BR47_9BACT|nr:methyltransferase domain-containing protein [Candidatus Methylacidithermus pantelleriae]CAF0703765.1 SAM-dependent methyltransferase [Candidatus Methylacidithermus pantelleriae]
MGKFLRDPSYWDERYRAGDHPWDRGSHAPPLEEVLELYPWKGRVLVPGCGTGHDVRFLAAAGLEAVGIDFSTEAIARARSFTKTPKAIFYELDLFSLPPSWNDTFDYVWEHTCLCALQPEDRQHYVHAVHRVLKPGGSLVGVFFLVGSSQPPPYGFSPPELDQLFGALFWLEKEWLPGRSYPGREGEELVRWYRKEVR